MHGSPCVRFVSHVQFSACVTLIPRSRTSPKNVENSPQLEKVLEENFEKLEEFQRDNVEKKKSGMKEKRLVMPEEAKAQAAKARAKALTSKKSFALGDAEGEGVDGEDVEGEDDAKPGEAEDEAKPEAEDEAKPEVPEDPSDSEDESIIERNIFVVGSSLSDGSSGTRIHRTGFDGSSSRRIHRTRVTTRTECEFDLYIRASLFGRVVVTTGFSTRTGVHSYNGRVYIVRSGSL